MEESEASASRIDRGKHVEHIEVLKHVNVSRSDSFGDHVDGEAVGRGTGCSNAGTSGSVGAVCLMYRLQVQDEPEGGTPCW